MAEQVSYTMRQIARLGGVSPRQMRYWLRQKLVSTSIQHSRGRPGHPYLFSATDVVRVRAVAEAKKEGQTLYRIHRRFRLSGRKRLTKRERIWLAEDANLASIATGGRSKSGKLS